MMSAFPLSSIHLSPTSLKFITLGNVYASDLMKLAFFEMSSTNIYIQSRRRRMLNIMKFDKIFRKAFNKKPQREGWKRELRFEGAQVLREYLIKPF
jgi:hypothetical protein